MKKMLVAVLAVGMMLMPLSALAAAPVSNTFVCPNKNEACITAGACINDGACVNDRVCIPKHDGIGVQNKGHGHGHHGEKHHR